MINLRINLKVFDGKRIFLLKCNQSDAIVISKKDEISQGVAFILICSMFPIQHVVHNLDHY